MIIIFKVIFYVAIIGLILFLYEVWTAPLVDENENIIKEDEDDTCFRT